VGVPILYEILGVVSSFLIAILALSLIIRSSFKGRVELLKSAMMDGSEGNFSDGRNMLLWEEKGSYWPTVSVAVLLSVFCFFYYLWRPAGSSFDLLIFITVAALVVFLAGLAYHYLVYFRTMANIVLVANEQQIEKVYVWKGKVRKRFIIRWDDVAEFWVSQSGGLDSPGETYGVVIQEDARKKILISRGAINSGLLCAWIRQRYPRDFFSYQAFEELYSCSRSSPQVFLTRQ
jgi:hypothetical protein